MTALSPEDIRSAAAICVYLAQRGHIVDFKPEKKEVVVHPTPSIAVVERLVANEPLLVAYFETLDNRPATNHAFAPLANYGPETAKTFATCMVCGVPWCLHGEPPASSWAPVYDISKVRVRACAPIVTHEVAA